MSQDTDNVPAISKTAFNCPHCNAYAAQHWNKLYAYPYKYNPRHPDIPDFRYRAKIIADDKMDKEKKANLIQLVNKILTGKPFIETQKASSSSINLLMNLNISICYNCREITAWCHDRIIYPATKIDIQPNEDMPDHIAKLFEEARAIANLSPRGAAALLRLCIQYLCKELGESGKNIDKDIANLVSKGLDPLVAKSLDIVRVIGNESVHPGQMDIDDNHDVALKLFYLVNFIIERMISSPKKIKALQETLPKEKREQIKQRDKKM